jgi:hypothetical protein
MASKDDWLSRNHTELIHQAQLTIKYLNDPANQARMGLIGVNLDLYLYEFIPKFDALLIAYTAWEPPSTRASVHYTALQSAEEAFKPVFRKLYIGYLKNNPLVSNTDLEIMGFPLRNSDRQATPIPTNVVHMDVDTSILRRITIYFRSSGRRNAAKPKGVHNAEIKWLISTTPIISIEDLHNTSICTRSPLTLEFDGNNRGQYLYFAICWVNTRGEKGPWSIIQHAIIP